MKLNDYCQKIGISYLTGYRWFKAGTFPAPVYQTESGTIIVEDDKISTSQQDAIALIMKKTIEYSQNNSTIEDFSAYIISNFNLSINNNVNPLPLDNATNELFIDNIDLSQSYDYQTINNHNYMVSSNSLTSNNFGSNSFGDLFSSRNKLSANITQPTILPKPQRGRPRKKT